MSPRGVFRAVDIALFDGAHDLLVLLDRCGGAMRQSHLRLAEQTHRVAHRDQRAQQKTVVQSYAQDGSGAKYTVLHVANDGVVIDHGRGQMAIYPLPHDISVRVGDRVWVDRDGRLGLSATQDVSDSKEVGR